MAVVTAQTRVHTRRGQTTGPQVHNRVGSPEAMGSALLSALLAAATAYLAFLAHAWAAGLTTGPTPNSAMARRHFQMLAVFATLGLLGHYALERSVPDALCWTFFFAAGFATFHHPWFSALIGVCTRSPSVAIVVAVSANPGLTRASLLDHGFANQTMENIIQDRIHWMLRFRLLRKAGDVYAVAPRGQVLNFVRVHVLKLWGLEQLGR